MSVSKSVSKPDRGTAGGGRSGRRCARTGRRQPPHLTVLRAAPAVLPTSMPDHAEPDEVAQLTTNPTPCDRKMNIHHCDSTFAAGALCEDGTASPGDILFIQSERVVGVAMPKPYAITVRAGTFAILPEGQDGDSIRQQFASALLTAQQLAQAMAIRLDPHYAIKADAIASANAYLHNVDVPTYSQLARAASLILEKHPYAGSEREGEELATLRQMVDAIPSIEFDPQEQRIGAPGRANPNDGRSGGDAV